VDYALFIIVMLVYMLERVEIPPVEAPRVFPRPIFDDFYSISVFLCYTMPHLQDALGDLYIGIFRSRPSGRALDGWLWTLEEGKRWCGAAKGGGHATQALLAFGPPFVRFQDSKMFVFVKY
jgi:hypothetical protein